MYGVSYREGWVYMPLPVQYTLCIYGVSYREGWVYMPLPVKYTLCMNGVSYREGCVFRWARRTSQLTVSD